MTMIPLSSLADPAAFLKGARVPLVRVAPDPLPEWAQPMTERMRSWLLSGSFEWRVDSAWRFDGDEGCRQEVNMEWTALDPSDPDVARLCDRRIAGRVARHPFLWAVLSCREGFWEVIWGAAREIGRCGMANATHSIECAAENIPTARAALVLALYGRTP